MIIYYSKFSLDDTVDFNTMDIYTTTTLYNCIVQCILVLFGGAIILTQKAKENFTK
jgi:hypothetical protein